MQSKQLETTVQLKISGAILEGNLIIPPEALGIVLFAHGSGSSRFSPRNRSVSQGLVENGLATLLIDLLTKEEELIDEGTREYRFDIDFLAGRLVEVTDWLTKNEKTKGLRIGYFGASTGAAAALVAAAKRKNLVRAIVSRGGRPDLASTSLSHVEAPTLLIVGGDDYGVIELNQDAFELLSCKKRLEIIPGATHLFEEHGTLEMVAHCATKWFLEYL